MRQQYIPRHMMLQTVVHKLMGARVTPGLFPDHPGCANTTTAPSRRDSNFGQVYPVDTKLTEITRQNRVIYAGEIHSRAPVVAFQRAILHEMLQCSRTVHVVVEHFALDQQDLLDRYTQRDSPSKISWTQLLEEYKQSGSEAHDMEPYRPLFDDVASSTQLRLYAGFLPRRYAKRLMKDGPEQVWQELQSTHWLPQPYSKTFLTGSQLHYNIFESLITGRPVLSGLPSDRLRGIFLAQILKDVAMAHIIQAVMKNDDFDPQQDRILVIAGNGHVQHYCGVPERVPTDLPCCVIVSHDAERVADLDNDAALLNDVQDMFGPAGTNPGDYVFVFREGDPPSPATTKDAEEARRETQRAYDAVGATAHVPGNVSKAKAIMSALGYSVDEMTAVGTDVDLANFQGVGHPHRHAHIARGDIVADLGSGLGSDSFIAAHATGPSGRVVGIDAGRTQTAHAQARAHAPGKGNVQFVLGDIEQLPLDADSIDVIVSNGAFCLVPDKRRASAEVYRVLKPGSGRLAICTTTTHADELAPGVEWSLCMKMFIGLHEVEPMLRDLGFVDIHIDDSDSRMST